MYDSITMPLFGSVSHLSSFIPVMRRAWRKERHSLRQQHRHDGDFDGIDQAGIDERAEHRAAAEQPDVFARLLLQLADGVDG